MSSGEDPRPARQDLVDVLLDSATEPVVTTVREVTDVAVLLEAPTDRAGRLVLPAPDEGGLLIWRGARAMMQAPVTVVDVQRRPAPSWSLRLNAVGMPCQRRSFVRATVAMPAVLHHGEDRYEATAVDLSEGGMRCRTKGPLPVMSGTDVTAELTVDGACVTLAARLTRVRHGERGMPTDVGLTFTGLKIRDADRMRRIVFDQLRRERARHA
jgi:PilZ domain